LAPALCEIMSGEEEPVLPEDETEEYGEEATPAERVIRCKLCGEEVLFKEYMSHLKERHPEEFEEKTRKLKEGRKRAWERLKEERLRPPEAEEEEMPPEQMVSLYGREGLDRLKRRQLERALASAPGVKPSQVTWVLYRWDMYQRCREDPSELFKILHDEAGINERIANAIVQSVFSIEAQYGHLLARREPVYVGGPRPPEPRPEFIYARQDYPRLPVEYQPSHQTRYYWYQHEPIPPPPPPTPQYYWQPAQTPREELTREEVAKMIREAIREFLSEREEKEEREEIWKTLEGMKDYVEELKHEFEKKLLEAGKRSEEPPEVRELKQRLEKYEEEIKSLQNMIAERERKALESRIRDLEAELRAARQEIASLASYRPSEGYSQDTYRLLADALHVAAQRRPLQDLGRLLWPEKFYPQTPPSPARLPPEVEEELERYGLIER